MRLSKSWIIAAKDFKTLRKKKNIIYTLFVIPFLIAILIPAVIDDAGQRNGSNRMSPPSWLYCCLRSSSST